MIKIEINGQLITAPEGAMLIDVADDAGIQIPRFCYHKKLSIAANCRMCLVEVENAPKPLPACATPVADGMRVYTGSPIAVAAQKAVMEFLLINHPLDCPICDQGGECELQDMAMEYGSDGSRYTEEKRILPRKDGGPLISMDMTRCIHCTRCVRFGQEIAGLMELGATGRSEYMEIGTYIEKNINSELSGNLVDVCPVGALTAKPFRYKVRSWELTAYAGISLQDPLGSHFYAHAKDGKIYRCVPREEESINEVWLSDRDRYAFESTYAVDRLTQPMVKRKGKWFATTWEEALEFAAQGLKPHIQQTQMLVSPFLTAEEIYLANLLAQKTQMAACESRFEQIDFRLDGGAPLNNGLSIPLADVEKQEAIVLLGCQLRRDIPLLNHRVRKASLKKAKILIKDVMPWDVNYPVVSQETWAAQDWAVGLDAMLDSASEGFNMLNSAKRSLIFVGQGLNSLPNAAELLVKVAKLAQATQSELCILPQGGNGRYANLIQKQPGLVKNPKGLLTIQTEIQHDGFLAKHQDTWQAAEFAVALSSFDTAEQRELYDVLLPMATNFETAGSQWNLLGNWQEFNALSRSQDETKPAWKILRVLANYLDVPGFDFMQLDEVSAKAKQLIAEVKPMTTAELAHATLSGAKAASGEYSINNAYQQNPLVRRSPSLQATLEAQLVQHLSC